METGNGGSGGGGLADAVATGAFSNDVAVKAGLHLMAPFSGQLTRSVLVYPYTLGVVPSNAFDTVCS